MNHDVLISEEKLDDKIREIAKEIKKDYGENLICIPVLEGAMTFFSKLNSYLESYDMKVESYPVKVRSYSGTESTGKHQIDIPLEQDITGKDVLIIEDIVDTGNTVGFLRDYLSRKGARKIKLCTLLDKPSRRINQTDIDYKGFEVPDVFVIGFGMDYEGRYRELPYVAVSMDINS